MSSPRPKKCALLIGAAENPSNGWCSLSNLKDRS